LTDVGTGSVDVAIEALRGLRLPDFILPYRELPSHATASIEKLIDVFARANPAERERIVKKVERSFAFVFSGYAQRAAEESVRRRAPELLMRGLIALAIEDARVDWRDTLPFLAFLYNSARKLRVNASELFRDAARIACPRFRRLIESFIIRDEASRSVESFHYKESGEGDSFSYVHVEPSSRPPSRAKWKIRMFVRRLRRVLQR
jgi:hypothetical protein